MHRMVTEEMPHSPDSEMLDDALPRHATLGAAAHSPQHTVRDWVPIRSLGSRHRQRLLDHLLLLDANDRLLRFGYAASDERIAAYVQEIDFDHDQVFGVFDRRLRMIAQAHLAFDPVGAVPSGAAEFGVSVLPKARGQAMGTLLFNHAVLIARNRGVRQLRIHLLRQNRAMLAIVKHAGAAIDFDGGDATARVTLPPDTLGSQIGELIGHRAAEFDYRLKRHGLQRDLLHSLSNTAPPI